MSGKPAGALSALKISTQQRGTTSGSQSTVGSKLTLVLVALASAGSTWWIGDFPQRPPRPAADSPAKPQRALTATATDNSPPGTAEVSQPTEANGRPRQFSSTGYVQATEKSQVAPKVPGRVLRVHIHQGDRVEAGQLLIELDPADEAAALLVAQHEEKTAHAQARQAQTKIAVVEANYAVGLLRARRAQQLSNQGVTASGAAEDLNATAAALEIQIRAAKAEALVAQAKTQEAAARVALRRTQLLNLSLIAPFRGVVVNEPPHAGEFIGPQPAGVAVDMGGLRIANLSTLIVETDIPETRYRLLTVGTPTKIYLDAFPGSPFVGRVATVTSEVNRAKATIRVNVAFVGKTAGVVPNLAARVEFLMGKDNRKQEN